MSHFSSKNEVGIIFLGKANLTTRQTFVIVRGRVAAQLEGQNEMSNRRLDTEFEISRITNFLRAHLWVAKSKGFVVGISGGIDSAVVASLCHKTVGAENVIGVLLFEDYHRASNDYQDANTFIQMLKIRSIDLPLTPVVQSLEHSLVSSNIKPSKIALANLRARARMTLLYSIANNENYLVVGTGDKSEDLIGYFTKYGDGGVDLLPIAHLYKTQVRLLGRALGVPDSIVTKPSSPNLWKEHKATDEIPAEYETLDEILSLLYDENLGPGEVSKRTGASLSVVDEVIRRNLNSRHKRSYPPMVESW